jgi:lactoylglutathione lyase
MTGIAGQDAPARRRGQGGTALAGAFPPRAPKSSLSAGISAAFCQAQQGQETVMTVFTYDHVHLRSPDAEETARWYERMFGAEIVRSVQSDGKPRLDLKLGGVAVFIAQVAPDKVGQPPEPPYLGLEHIGLRVAGIDKAVAELKQKGAEFTVEPRTIRPGVRIAFLRGPQNVHIELLDRSAG